MREYQEEQPLLLVRIAQGEAAPVKELYSRLKPQLYHNLAQDAELLPLLADSRFAEIRRENPFALPRETSRVSVVLFLRTPLAFNADKLSALCQDAAPQRVHLLPSPERDRQTFLVAHSQGSMFITSGTSRYLAPAAEQEPLGAPQRSAVKSEIADHQAWLAIDLLDSAEVLAKPRGDQLAKRFLHRLLDDRLLNDNLLAVGLAEEGGLMTLASRGAAHPELLLTENSWHDLVGSGTQVWWGPRVAQGDEPSSALTKKQIRAFAAAVAKLPADQFAQLKVRLKLGHAEEDAWLKLRSIQRQDYGYTFSGELQEDSKIWPHLRAGERCTVNAWQVRETKLP